MLRGPVDAADFQISIVPCSAARACPKSIITSHAAFAYVGINGQRADQGWTHRLSSRYMGIKTG
jgi:hypothetical protein